MDLKKYIRSIQDYPKKGILFRDITTLIKNAEAFKYTNDKIIEISKKIKFDKVAAIESRGFVFASTVSYLMKKPFILLRKKNKLPAETHSIDFELEYGKATIEVHKDSINKGEKILIIDDKFPSTTMGAGFGRAADILEILQKKSVFVSYYLTNHDESNDEIQNTNHFNVEFALKNLPKKYIQLKSDESDQKPFYEAKC